MTMQQGAAHMRRPAVHPMVRSLRVQPFQPALRTFAEVRAAQRLVVRAAAAEEEAYGEEEVEDNFEERVVQVRGRWSGWRPQPIARRVAAPPRAPAPRAMGRPLSAAPRPALSVPQPQVRRVTKVVKGGKQLSFRAVVVVGDQKGTVGVGCDSAKEVAQAVRKAVTNAKRNLVTVPLTKNYSFPHKYEAEFKSAKVRARQGAVVCKSEGCGRVGVLNMRVLQLEPAPCCPLEALGLTQPARLLLVQVMLRPAADGTGVIAGGAVRVVLELAGLKNGFGKQIGRCAAVAGWWQRLAAQVTRHTLGLAAESMSNPEPPVCAAAA